MAYVEIDKAKLEAAYRYWNLTPDKPKRDYAFAYISWLRNGAEGIEPQKGRLSHCRAREVRMMVDLMKLWE